jgi:hypothetical protein
LETYYNDRDGSFLGLLPTNKEYPYCVSKVLYL